MSKNEDNRTMTEEEVNAAVRAYYKRVREKNKEKYKEYQKKYYLKNREAILTKMREYKQRKKEEGK